jgi:adenylate kinase family enzyme
MEKMEQSFMHELVFVTGRTSSGKSTFAKALAAGSNTQFLEVSSIVKGIMGTVARSAISCNKDLDTLIVAEIKKQLDKGPLIVSGARQWSVIEPFASFAKIIWLEVPFATRQAYFTKRGDAADDITLEMVDKRDEELGLLEVISGINALEQSNKTGRYNIL